MQPLDHELRPCEGCDIPCACHKRSHTCCCNCSPNCEQAAYALSSEPKRYPIEQKVLPLVYGLMSLRIIKPCWSCEGHVENGRFKIPQVWFYAASVIYAQLISEHLSDMNAHHKLSCPWEVSICNHQTTQNATIFVIQPAFMVGMEFHLGKMQMDLRILAESLVQNVRCLAKQKLDAVSSTVDS